MISRMRRPRRRERQPTESIYGPDPGDASVEYHYMEVRDQIRLGIGDLLSYPNEGPREKEKFLAQALIPGRKNRGRRALLGIILTLMGVGENEKSKTRRG